jgi:hypothetical protein
MLPGWHGTITQISSREQQTNMKQYEQRGDVTKA